jgi:N-acetylglutamate synthase-like GNAT family acetyltransferase
MRLSAGRLPCIVMNRKNAVSRPTSQGQGVSEIHIRKMRNVDVPACMAILEGWNMAPRPQADGAAEPERTGIEVANGFVAEVDGRVVGTCGYIIHSPELAETASLAVAPSFRGARVGFLLQSARLDEMRRRGIRRVRTEADRPETIRWYVEMFGYRIVGTNPKKHAFSLEDVDFWTVLELDLG